MSTTTVAPSATGTPPVPAPPRTAPPAVHRTGQTTTMAPSTRRARKRWWPWSLTLCVIGAGLYYGYAAEDRWAAEARFTVEGGATASLAAAASASPLANLIGVGAGTRDLHAIRLWLRSPSAAEALMQTLPLRDLVAAPGWDLLWWMDPQPTREQMQRRLEQMIDVVHDEQAGVTILRAQAFSPDGARKLADTALALASERIEAVSHQLADEDVRAARQEMTEAEHRVIAAREKVVAFQDRHGEIDPLRSGRQTMELIGGIESRLAQQRADLAAMHASFNEGAPQLVAARARIAELERQLVQARSTLAGPAPAPGEGEKINDLLASFRGLQTDLEFAERTYAATLAGVESARIRASRRQKRLAVLASPVEPQEATNPRRITAFLSVVLTAAILHGIALMGLAIFRDQRGQV